MACTSAIRVDLVAYVGATFSHRFAVKDPDGSDHDWTTPATTAKMQVRAAINGDVIVELTEGNGLTLDASGNIDVLIAASETWTTDGSELLAPAVYLYDLVTTQGGVVTRIVEGNMRAVPRVTQ